MLPGERTDLKCPEPGCSGMLVLKKSKYGHFYGCETWGRTGCAGAHGAHPDGAPLGIPASKATREARIRAHEAFDRLWKGPKARMRRGEAYAWLQEAMGMTEDAAHIGRFTIEQCDELCRVVAADGEVQKVLSNHRNQPNWQSRKKLRKATIEEVRVFVERLRSDPPRR